MANPTTVRQFLIASLIFTAVIAGSFAMISMTLPSDVGEFSDYNRSFNKFIEIRANAERMSSTIEDAKPAEGIEGILTGLYEVSFGAVKQVWTSITTMKVLIGDFSSGGLPFRVPTWLTSLFIGIITTVVIFAIIASWRKWHT